MTLPKSCRWLAAASKRERDARHRHASLCHRQSPFEGNGRLGLGNVGLVAATLHVLLCFLFHSAAFLLEVPDMLGNAGLLLARVP